MTTPEFSVPTGHVCQTVHGLVLLAPNNFLLEEGVHTFQITWEGTSELRLVINRSGQDSYWVPVISSGSGVRSTIVNGFGVAAGETVTISLRCTSYSETPGTRATLVDIPIPLAGQPPA